MALELRTLAALAVAVFVVASPPTSASGQDGDGRRAARGPAKHIILMVGDGMHVEHEIAASRYLFGRDFALAFHRLPYQADQATWDVGTYGKYGGTYDPEAIVPTIGYDPRRGGLRPHPLAPEPAGALAYHTTAATDSASAATAWATGYKTDDGNIAWLPGDPARGGNRADDGSLKTVAELLRERRGWAIGVVSTVPFTHATPAAFVAHSVSRNRYHAIGEEILARTRPEVVIGAGHAEGASCANPLSSRYVAAETLARVCGDAGYRVVTRAEGVDGGAALLQAAQQAAAEGRRLFGLFGGRDGHFESPRPLDLPGTPRVVPATRANPSYAEATLAALKVLGRNPNGFFLMAEQGDIDWANHGNDFARMVGTIKDLHDGVQAVIDFVNQPGDDVDWDNTLLIVTSDHGNNRMRLQARLGAGKLPRQEAMTTPALPDGVADRCHNDFCYPDGEVSFASRTHTNELTRIYATGAGVDRFAGYEGRWYPGTRIVDNTQLFHVMMEAAGVPVRSPLRVAR